MKIARRQKFDIDSLNVASPCPVSWESMTGDDRSRMCGQCERRIYNISRMSSAEAYELITGSSDRVCVRLFRRADGKVMTSDCPKGLAACRKRIAAFAGAAFAALLGLFSVSSAQRPSFNDSQGTRSETSVTIPIVQGTVKDPTGVPIPSATVKITTSSGKVLTAATNQKGHFRLMSSLLDRGRNRISIEANYFHTYKDEFSIYPREMLDYSVTLSVGGFIGVVTVSPRPMIDPGKSSVTTTIRFDQD